LEPLDSIDEMAALYLEALTETVPDGPVRLAGWSFGGFVAYEMACRLREAGREVDLLALLDTGVPEDWGERHDLDLLTDVVGERLPAELLDEMAELDGIDLQIERMVERARAMGLLPGDFEASRARRMFEVHRRNYDAVPRHAFRPYPGELCLVRTARTAEIHGDDPTLGWGELVGGGVEVTDVAGTHTTLLDPPYDQEVAAALRAWLDRRPERRAARPVS
jgi:thioesterase domain-containing protein